MKNFYFILWLKGRIYKFYINFLFWFLNVKIESKNFHFQHVNLFNFLLLILWTDVFVVKSFSFGGKQRSDCAQASKRQETSRKPFSLSFFQFILHSNPMPENKCIKWFPNIQYTEWIAWYYFHSFILHNDYYKKYLYQKIGKLQIFTILSQI